MAPHDKCDGSMQHIILHHTAGLTKADLHDEDGFDAVAMMEKDAFPDGMLTPEGQVYVMKAYQNCYSNLETMTN